MTPEIFPDSIEAKCSECGHIWEYARHDSLACPFCNARLESVVFSFDKSYAYFEGRRWKDINREDAAARGQRWSPEMKARFEEWRLL